MVILWGGIIGLVALIWDKGLVVGIGCTLVALFIALVGLIGSEAIVTRTAPTTKMPPDDELYQLVKKVCDSISMRMPRVYLVKSRKMNAFATGLRLPGGIFGMTGAVGITVGLQIKLSEEELEAVIAHELTHLRSGDVAIAAMAGALISSLALLLEVILRYPSILGKVKSTGGRTRSRSSRRNSSGDGNLLNTLVAFILIIFVVMIIAILVLLITQLLLPAIRAWMNRQREFWADAGACEIIGSPWPLQSALGKLSQGNTSVDGVGQFSAGFYNVDPRQIHNWVGRLMATHPDITTRIVALSRRNDGEFNM
ncbi:MAG: M48 family metallopeptidase [Patescibacteria group bacterium]